MNVTIFRGLAFENFYSMRVYADNLVKNFPDNVLVKDFAFTLPVSFLKKPLSKWILYPLAARANQSEINHIIDHGYSQLLLSLDKSKTIVTCHDLHPLELPETVSWKTRWLFRKKIALMLKARRVIAVSGHTKGDILKHFPKASAESIDVVYNGVDEQFKPLSRKQCTAFRARLGLQGKKIVLHVGLPFAYKNVATLLRAIAVLRKSIPELHFVKVGDFLPEEERLIRELNLSETITKLGFVALEELIGLYNISSAFVFPSLHEGFGFPVLEAMRCNCPVVCSSAGALPEITENAALLVSPFDKTALANAIKQVLESDSLRKNLAKKGAKQAKKFSWKKTARKTISVYEEALGK